MPVWCILTAASLPVLAKRPEAGAKLAVTEARSSDLIRGFRTHLRRRELVFCALERLLLAGVARAHAARVAARLGVAGFVCACACVFGFRCVHATGTRPSCTLHCYKPHCLVVLPALSTLQHAALMILSTSYNTPSTHLVELLGELVVLQLQVCHLLGQLRHAVVSLPRSLGERDG